MLSGLIPVKNRGKLDWTNGEVHLQSRPNNSINQPHRDLELGYPISELKVEGCQQIALSAAGATGGLLKEELGP